MDAKLFIGGRWAGAADGAEFVTVDPATGEPLGRCAEANADDVDAAVRAALADPEWAAMPPGARARLLWRVADLVEEHATELAELETRDPGQPPDVAKPAEQTPLTSVATRRAVRARRVPRGRGEPAKRVDAYVRTGRDEGAVQVCGGEQADGRGYFYRPTVFAGVSDEMTIAREEIFGPVMPVLTYEDPEEVTARANDTAYGLAAAVWTRDLRTAHRLAAEIRAGAVFVNMPPIPDPAAPWGGYRTSGWGREMGPYAIDAYTEVKGVWVHTG